MSERLERLERKRTSRQRYRGFIRDYKLRRLDKPADSPAKAGEPTSPSERPARTRGEHLREYLRWLRPHRYAVAALFLLALGVAGLEMIEPLFMRYIVDRVLLNADLTPASRLTHLH